MGERQRNPSSPAVGFAFAQSTYALAVPAAKPAGQINKDDHDKRSSPRRRRAGRDRSRFHHHVRARRARRWRRRDRGRRREFNRSSGLRCIRTGICPRCIIRRSIAGARPCSVAACRAAGALDAGQEGLVRDLAARRAGSCRRAEQRARGRLHAQDPGRRSAQENCRALSQRDQAVRSLFERARSGHRSDPRPDDREPARRRIPASQRRSAREGQGPPRYRCVLRDRSCGPQPWRSARQCGSPRTSNCVNHSGRSNSASRRPSR